MTPRSTLVTSLAIAFALTLPACMIGDDDSCYDDDDHPIACESVPAGPELPDDATPVETLADLGGADGPADFVPGPDDLDGPGDESVEVPLTSLAPDDEVANDFAALPANGPGTGSSAIDWGRTKRAELRKFLPIGRTAGVKRFVVMRLKPSDLPGLRDGDMLRAAAEIQLTTRCDIGQQAPGCGYAPRVRLQLVLSGHADTTNPHAAGARALSHVTSFDCTANDHHCLKIINFSAASAKLDAHSTPCLADQSCYVNLVAWAYHPDARSSGKDVLLLGANEGNFLDNGNIEQDRGRIMAIRERDLSAADVSLRVTGHNVKHDPMVFGSNGDWHRIYSHTLNHGQDLRAGEKFRVWADVEASSNSRVNLSLLMFLTKNRLDHNGGGIADTSPKAISEHNGTNCSPGNDCHLRKVALFEVDHDIPGPVYVNIAASTEVPGPGAATTTIHDSGSIKSFRYAR